MNLVLIIIVILIIFGLPNWGYHHLGWGPSGFGGLILIILVLWLLFGGR